MKTQTARVVVPIDDPGSSPEQSATCASVPERARTWSERLWDIDWDGHLPWQNEHGIVCERTTIDQMLPFIREHYDDIFASAPRHFHQSELTEAKLRFYRDADVFRFTHDGREVGVCVSHPLDWESYYLRNTAILPDAQNKHALQDFIARVAGVLKDAGVTRLESHTAPANHRVVHLSNQSGFMVTGTSHTERWGALVHVTKYLDAGAETAFVRRFCMGGWDDPRRHPNLAVCSERRDP